MKSTKFIVSAATTVAIVSAIGFAYAQTPAGQNDPNLGKNETPFADSNQNFKPRNPPVVNQPGTVYNSAPAPSGAASGGTSGGYSSSSSGTGAMGATPSSEPVARADRN